MSERPVEELIGWASRFPPARGTDWRGWIASDGTYRIRAEVDDLAAWLDKRFAPSLWYAHRDDDKWYIDFGFDYEHRQLAETTDAHPTIRDALIAAVRKVAA